MFLLAHQSLVEVTDAASPLSDVLRFGFAGRLQKCDRQKLHAPAGQLYDPAQLISGEKFLPNLSSERIVLTSIGERANFR